jgi:hypothetical protein
MSKFVNLTAHPIKLLNLGITIPHANRPVKVTQNQKLLSVIDGIPIYEIEFVDIAGLPEEEEGTIYIVSAPVLNYIRQKLPHRNDFVSPFKAIKDPMGKTIGCQSFRVNG